MLLKFRDRNYEVINSLKQQFVGIPNVTFHEGDVFVDDDFDAIISPANSFGYMDGGIDRVYLDKFGWNLQDEVQTAIREHTRFKELLVGDSLTVQIPGTEKYLIVAPTMRLPGPIPQTNVFLAMRAAMYFAKTFDRVVCPGLGTATGNVPAHQAAFAMKSAYGSLIKT